MTGNSEPRRGPIHDAAAAGYSAAADTYVTGRPGYPPEAAAWLRDVVGARAGRTVLELGAGAGAFTSMLQDTGARSIAVEPVASMRARLAHHLPGVAIVAGTADAIPLREGSVDAVVCAQSFHWFATRAALDAIARVLVPGGVLGLIWNVRDETVPWVAALSAITDAVEGDTPRYKTGRWREAFRGSRFTAVDDRHARHSHDGDPEQVIVGRTLSVSFVAALPVEQRRAIRQRVRALIAATPALAGRSPVAFPYDTAMFAFRTRTPASGEAGFDDAHR